MPQELKGLTVVLDSTPTPFCLELAALAARREYLNLEKWLTEQFTAKGVAFMQVRTVHRMRGAGMMGAGGARAGSQGGGATAGLVSLLLLCVCVSLGWPLPLLLVLFSFLISTSHAHAFHLPVQASVTFLDSKLHDEPLSSLGVVGAPTARINISVETLAIFLRVLASNAGLLPTDALQQFKVVQTAAVQEHPQLQAVVGDGSSLEAFASDIEEEANAYFQRIYAGELTVEGLVEVLRGFKASTVGREQEVFACMVHNLFDEYRFFPKYPDKELHTTGGGGSGRRWSGRGRRWSGAGGGSGILCACCLVLWLCACCLALWLSLLLCCGLTCPPLCHALPHPQPCCLVS